MQKRNNPKTKNKVYAPRDKANRWLYRIYRMLNNTGMRFRLNRRLMCYGISTITIDRDAEVVINPEKKEFMSTIVHECLHLVDWDMAEERVMKLERLLMRHLTDRQLLNLLRKIIILHT